MPARWPPKRSSYDASLNYLLRKAWLDLHACRALGDAGTIAWIVIAYYFHQSMIDAVTGARDVTRAEQPRLYNLLGKSLHLARHHDAEAQGDGERRAQRLRLRHEREAVCRHGDDRASWRGSTMPRWKRCSATN